MLQRLLIRQNCLIIFVYCDPQAIRMVDDSLDGFGHITADLLELFDEDPILVNCFK